MPETFTQCPTCLQDGVHQDDLIAVSRMVEQDEIISDPACSACRESFRQCENCNQTYDPEAGPTYSGHCQHCATAMARCIGCEEPDFTENLIYTERLERGPGLYCSDCFSDADEEEEEDDEYPEESSPLIREYSYKMPTYPFNRNGGRYMVGIEYEIEVDRNADFNRVAKAFRDLVQCNDDRGNYICLKNDGSLQRGFEMVTRPASIKEHKSRLQNLFNNMPKEMRVSERCGLHIHVNKGSGKNSADRMSRLQIGKMRVFSASAETQSYITTICGRAPNTYCMRYEQKSPSKVKRGALESDFERLVRQSKLSGKYMIWNETEYTMEFRAPASTLSMAEFWARVEMAVALPEYCSTVSIKNCQSLNQFIEWLKVHSKSYPCLSNATETFMGSTGGKKRGKSWAG